MAGGKKKVRVKMKIIFDHLTIDQYWRNKTDIKGKIALETMLPRIKIILSLIIDLNFSKS